MDNNYNTLLLDRRKIATLYSFFISKYIMSAPSLDDPSSSTAPSISLFYIRLTLFFFFFTEAEKSIPFYVNLGQIWSISEIENFQTPQMDRNSIENNSNRREMSLKTHFSVINIIFYRFPVHLGGLKNCDFWEWSDLA